MKKISYDEVKLAFENKGYELISQEYINCEAPLLYICDKHRDKGIQDINYAHLKRGQGCRFCGQENKRSGKQKDLSEYNAEELTESKGIEFVKITRENSILYIYYICPKHRDKGIQKTTLGSMRKKKVGCPYCIGRNKTTDDFKIELALLNPNIEILSEYVSATDTILCRCKIDSTEWKSNPNTLLNGEGCPTCGRLKSSQSRSKSNEQFLLELNEKNIQITPLEQYINTKSQILVQCDICGFEWRTSPDNILRGNKCPECSKTLSHDRQAKSNEQFLEELSLVNPHLTPLEKYYNDCTKIKVKCEIHDFVWDVAPNKILHRSTGCPKCAMYSNEAKIERILNDLGYNNIIPQKRFIDCKDKHTLPFDLYIEELPLLIEYQGEQHYKPIRRGNMSENKALEALLTTQRHDEIKKEYCKLNNIPLLCIPYWENKNLETIIYNAFCQYKFPINRTQNYSNVIINI